MYSSICTTLQIQFSSLGPELPPNGRKTLIFKSRIGWFLLCGFTENFQRDSVLVYFSTLCVVRKLISRKNLQITISSQLSNISWNVVLQENFISRKICERCFSWISTQVLFVFTEKSQIDGKNCVNSRIYDFTKNCVKLPSSFAESGLNESRRPLLVLRPENFTEFYIIWFDGKNSWNYLQPNFHFHHWVLGWPLDSKTVSSLSDLLNIRGLREFHGKKFRFFLFSKSIFAASSLNNRLMVQ